MAGVIDERFAVGLLDPSVVPAPLRVGVQCKQKSHERDDSDKECWGY